MKTKINKCVNTFPPKRSFSETFKINEICYLTWGKGSKVVTGRIVDVYKRPNDAFGPRVEIEIKKKWGISTHGLWMDEVWHTPEMAKKYPVL